MDRHVLALLTLRAADSRMPVLYREALGAADPLLAVLNDPRLKLEWPALAYAVSDQRLIGDATEDLNRWRDAGIIPIALGDPEYPRALLSIFDPPPILYVKGNIQEISLGVAIVGSRRAEPAATAAAKILSAALVRSGAVVISGLAIGVDTAAHRAAIDAGGSFPTVAVLGTGVDRIYPASNRQLAQAIVQQGGLLLSQFEPGSAVYPSNFLARNRIIAGLSRGVVLIQAAKSSGSLATARFALEEGRDVFVVPGAFGDIRYEGSHQLLRDGATVTTEFLDLQSVYPELNPVSVRSDNRNANQAGTSCPLGGRIIEVIRGQGELDPSEIGAHLQTELPEIEAALLGLELDGRIERVPGNRVRLGHLN